MIVSLLIAALLQPEPTRHPDAVELGLQPAPGAAWACSAEHEAWRKADLAVLRSEGPKGAAADVGRLEAALGHAPPQPLGGFAYCGGVAVAFTPSGMAAASLMTALSVRRAGPGQTAVVAPQSRPIPYTGLALLSGSLRNAAGRPDQAIADLDRGLASAPCRPA